MGYPDYDGMAMLTQGFKGKYAPQSRKVAGKPLTSDVALSASDVGAIPAGAVTAIWTGTQAAYDGIATKSPTTLYLIVG